MKRIIKTYFKFFIFLFGISLLLVNCEKDNFAENESKITVKIINLAQVESNRKVAEKLEKIISESKEESTKTFKRDIHYNSEYGFTIDTDYVKYIESGDYNSYNFPLTRDEPVDDKVENLFLSLNEEGNYEAFIVKYDFTYDEIGQLTVEILNNRTTIYTPIDYDSSFINTAAKTTTTIECSEQWEWEVIDDGDEGQLVGAGNEEPQTFGWVLVSRDCEFVYGGGTSPTNTDPPPNGDGTTNDCDTCGANGGNTTGDNTNNEVDNIASPTISYSQQIAYCLGPVDGGFDYTIWLNDSNTPKSEIGSLANYLNENCTVESQSFGLLAAEVNMNGGEVDYNDRFFYFSTWEDYPCQKNIVEDANSGNFGEIGEAIQLFFSDNSLFENPNNIYVNYDIESLGGTHLAETGINMVPLTGDLLEININFDQTFIEGSTDLGIFSVAIHENLHALLALFLDLDIIDVNDINTNLSSLANEYAERKALFLIDSSIGWDATDSGFLEHEIISELITALELEIKNYGESKGYVIDDFVYEALAWGGLESTTPFLELPSDEQDLIHDTIGYEIQNFTLLAQGTPCN